MEHGAKEDSDGDVVDDAVYFRGDSLGNGFCCDFCQAVRTGMTLPFGVAIRI